MGERPRRRRAKPDPKPTDRDELRRLGASRWLLGAVDRVRWMSSRDWLGWLKVTGFIAIGGSVVAYLSASSEWVDTLRDLSIDLPSFLLVSGGILYGLGRLWQRLWFSRRVRRVVDIARTAASEDREHGITP